MAMKHVFEWNIHGEHMEKNLYPTPWLLDLTVGLRTVHELFHASHSDQFRSRGK